ncbi:hypothetical protein CHUAL_004132 [Chamberlinius hualienensis]
MSSQLERSKLYKLIDLSADIMKSGDILLKLRSPEQYNKFQVLMNPNWFKLNNEIRPIPAINFNQLAFSRDEFATANTDQCIGEMLNRCQVSDECWERMTRPYQSGYMTTHQLLFLIVGQNSCRQSIEDAIKQKTNMTSLIEHYDVLCANIYEEMKHIEVEGRQEIYRDLYCEQAMFCSMVGYPQMLSMTTLKSILSWQSSDGCYRYSSVLNVTIPRDRIKRNELLNKDLCRPHYTVVCGGAIASYIRYLIGNSTLNDVSI